MNRIRWLTLIIGPWLIVLGSMSLTQWFGRSAAQPVTGNHETFVQLDQVVRRAIEMFQGVAEEHGIELDLPALAPVTVIGDANRLREVVNNLIDNSLKFTSNGGVIRIALDFDAAREQAVLRVSDPGAGIAPDDLPHIFERFYCGDRSRARGTQTRGNGLGLSICQAIVAAHGGSIEVESTPGRGSTFTVALPARAGQPAEPVASSI